MESSTRRNFAKTLGLVGLVAVGVKGYQEATKIIYKQDELPTKELEAFLEKKPVLQLQATYGEEISNYTDYTTPNGQSYRIMGMGTKYKEGTEVNVKVNIVPGPDGKLYVKENDTWRKI
jgi:hypothetical protein